MDGSGRNKEDGEYNDYRRKVSAFVQAVTTADNATVSRLFPEICDNPFFDTALAEITSAKDGSDFDHVDFRYDVLSMSSITCVKYNTTTGAAHAPIQLFFVPLSGPHSAVQSVSDNVERLTEIGKSFIEADLATPHSSIVVSGSLVDPDAASLITPGKIRLALRMISPVLTGKIATDTLGEALAAVFGIATETHQLGDPLVHRLLPVARIVTSPDGTPEEDPLSSFRIDAVAEERFPIKRWRRRIGEIVPKNVVVGDPCSIMRGCAAMAASMIEHAFLSRSVRLGHPEIPAMDRISLSRTEDSIRVVGTRGRAVYGPVTVPATLFSSDMAMMTDFIDGLSDNVSWLDEPASVLPTPRPH